MKNPVRHLLRAWLLVPVCALGFMAWADYARLLRVVFVTQVAQEGVSADPESSTGYADGKRWLIVPEHNNPSYQWIEETQSMLARGDWRVRSVEYENAPFGREVHSASPYRWWLVLVAWCEHMATSRPLAMCVERAALLADPLLHILLLLSTVIFVARRTGALAASLLSLGLIAMFPIGAAFLPGVANDNSLSLFAAFWSVLLLVTRTNGTNKDSKLYFAAGAAGGCGLWISVSGQVPFIIGIALGAFLVELVGRFRLHKSPDRSSGMPPWRAWAFGGATLSLLAYLIEYFPDHMGPQLRVNYPLYGIAWLGLGELLWRFAGLMRGHRPFGGIRDLGVWVSSAAAVASLPVAISWSGDHAFLEGDLLTTRLTNQPDGVVAASLSVWFAEGGITAAVAATLLPLIVLGPAAWLFVRRTTSESQRMAVAIAVGPVLVTLEIAIHHLSWWSSVDLSLLALLVAATVAAPTAISAFRKGLLWCGLLAAPFALGVVQVIPPPTSYDQTDFKFTKAEIEGLYERAIAHWISDHAGPDGATVLIPPFRTSSFCFYGGLRGLGTQNWENRDGLLATFRIVNSTRPEETQALISERGVTHIVIPSWDTDLDDFARMGLKQPMDSFIFALHQTDGGIFNWLRPLPYVLPPFHGLKEQSVLILEVTDETDPATLRSRLVECLIEMHQMDAAAYSSKALLRYPANLGALVALAEVKKALEDSEGFDKAFKSILSNIESGSDRSLPWDSRVSLSVILALGSRNDLARNQVKRCMAEANAARIRGLTTGSLYHLLVLARAYEIQFENPQLQTLAARLLTSELRERLGLEPTATEVSPKSY